MTQDITLTRENYQLQKDLTVYANDKLVNLFTSIPKINTLKILRGFDESYLSKFLDEAPEHLSDQWKMGLKHKLGSVGELMQPAPLALNENITIDDAISEVKKINIQKQFTYGIIVNDANDLTGVLVFKDVFYHEPNKILKDICIKNPICLKADDDALETFIKNAGKQIPELPVVDNEGKLIGILRGSHVNEAHALQISAQSGLMVGASPEEGLDSSVTKCVKLRGPWLLVNLITALLQVQLLGFFKKLSIKLFYLLCFYRYSQVNRET